MSALGGSVKECSIRGRIFAPASDAEVKMSLGGYVNDIHANGDGTARQEKTMTPAALEGLVIAIDHDKGDLSFLQEISDGNVFVPFSITYIDDTVFQGKAQIMG